MRLLQSSGAAACVAALVTVAACTEYQDFGTTVVQVAPPASDGSASGVDSAGDAGSDAQELDTSDAQAAAQQWQWLNPQPAGNQLRAVWATTADDVWLVGELGTVEHWDGTHVTFPYTGSSTDTFYAVWASSPNDVWIAGDGAGQGQSVVLHWDGTAWASEFTLGSQRVHSIWGTSPSSVWALTDDGAQGVIQYWNGTYWENDFSGDLNIDHDGGWVTPGFLRDLWGSSADDVWLVGDAGTIAHWSGGEIDNGDPWELESRANPSSPMNPFDTGNDYVGVWGSATNDVWAMFVTSVGYGFSHWDGTSWTVTQVPSEDTGACGGLIMGLLPQGPTRQGHILWGKDAQNILATSAVAAVTDWNCDPDAVFFPDPQMAGQWSAVDDGSGTMVRALGGVGTSLFAAGDFGTFSAWTSNLTAPLAPVLDDGVRFDFVSVAPVSGTEAWATYSVGVAEPFGLAHWDGAKWSTVPVGPTPNEWGVPELSLYAVAASGPSDVWSVGSITFGTEPGDTAGAIVHWDGSTWSDVLQISAATRLDSIWVESPTNAWIAGEGPPIDWTLPSLVVFHWDGTSWTQVPVPPQLVSSTNTSPGTSPPTITGAADGTVWIVGYMLGDTASLDYVLQWNGSAFVLTLPLQHVLDSPSFGGHSWGFSPSDFWVPVLPAMDFDGSTWTPLSGSTDYKTAAIAGTSSSDLWFAGAGPQGGALHHWDGNELTPILDATPAFSDLEMTPKHDFLWAVGQGGATLRLALPPASQ